MSGSRSATQAYGDGSRRVALSVIPGWSPIVQQRHRPLERIITGSSHQSRHNTPTKNEGFAHHRGGDRRPGVLLFVLLIIAAGRTAHVARQASKPREAADPRSIARTNTKLN